MMSDFRYSGSTTLASSPSLLAAARRTIGVSSWHKLRKWLLRSPGQKASNVVQIFPFNIIFFMIKRLVTRTQDILRIVVDTRGYATENRPQAEVLEVNQSPVDRRLTKGTKCASKSATECWTEIARRESTALSRTTVSSTVANDSSGA
jgi:hypothetical protein